MDLSTIAAVAGITLLSVASVYALSSLERARARVAASGIRRHVVISVIVSAGAVACVLSASPWRLPFAQATPAEQDDDVARLKAFASALAPSKAVPMSRIPTPDARAHNDLPDVDTMINRLAARLADAPDDGEGWKMLGWSLLHTDRPADAAKAYAKARMLMPASEEVGAALAEALIARDAGAVGDETQAVIDDVLRVAPDLPKARYFKALARAQRGEPAAALADMKAIEAETDGDALWIDQMRARIAQLSTPHARAPE